MTGHTSANPSPPPPGGRIGALLRMALRLVVIFAVIWAVQALLVWLTAQTSATEALLAAPLPLIIAIFAAYAIVIAVPFVPGVEIALVLLMVEGPQVAPVIYLSTVAGLYLAYLVGWALPYSMLRRLAADLSLHRLAVTIDRLAPLSPEARLAQLSGRLPPRLARIVGRHHHVILAILVNLPGSSLIGGGGGICVMAGLCRLYRPLPTLITLLIAVAPVPLAIMVFGAPKVLLPG